MRIPDEFLQEIKIRNDIEDVISRYVSLKNSGSNLTACCPFHSEKTPSFTIFRATKSFYCFGCGAGGDVITFMMKIENIDYITAITKLADFAKIPLPENDGEYREKIIQQKIIYDLNREAALYFHKNLYITVGKDALEYLHKRNITNPAIKHFGLGYAPDSWNDLTKYLSEKGFSKYEIKLAFLCGISKKGEYFDYFRNRIIFPIIDLQSNIIGFGGRTIGRNKDGSEVMPKYLNTSDTPAFKKSRNLYALNFAKTAASTSKRNYFILCEGYMDVISMHQAGFTNSVASLGTAVTSEHARIISKYTKTVVLAYDSDDAGKRAAERASLLLNEVGIEVKSLTLDGAKDPDEFIKRFGKERFENTLKESKGYTNSKLDNAFQNYNKNTDNIRDESERKIKAINEVCEILSKINSALEQEVYVAEAAKKYNISFDNLMREIKFLTKKRQRKETNEVINNELRKSEGLNDRINPDTIRAPKAVKIEETILGILMLYPELYNEINQDAKAGRLSEDIFITEFNRKIYKIFEETIKEKGFQNFDIAFVTKEFSADETGRITKMTVNVMQHTDNGKKRLEKLIDALEAEKDKQNVNPVDIISEPGKWADHIRSKADTKSKAQSNSTSDSENLNDEKQTLRMSKIYNSQKGGY